MPPQNNQTLYGQNNQLVVRFTTTSEAKSDKNRRNRQNTGYFPGIPWFSQVYPQHSVQQKGHGILRYTRKYTGYCGNFAEFGRKPASLGSEPEKMMIPRSVVFTHTTLCSYHTTPQENQISGKYHSFTSKWPSLTRSCSSLRGPGGPHGGRVAQCSGSASSTRPPTLTWWPLSWTAWRMHPRVESSGPK